MTPLKHTLYKWQLLCWIRHHKSAGKLFTAKEMRRLFLGFVIRKVLCTEMGENRHENVQLHSKNSLKAFVVGLPYTGLETVPLIDLFP